MSRYAKQILAAREIRVEVGAWTFVARRPDAMSVGAWLKLPPEVLSEKIVNECVIGWEGVLERDLIGGGGSDTPVPFDLEDYRTWVVDRPDVWAPLVTAVMQALTAWSEAAEKARKN